MRVLIADDHSLFRDGITSLLEAAGYEVVEQARDGAAAIEAAARLHPDLVLLDIVMPGMNGLEALKVIKARLPETRVVMLTVSDADEDLFAAIRLGADGYLLKDLNANEFLEMLTGLTKGEAAITRKTAARLMTGFHQLSQQAETTPLLTEKESEVLYWMGEGLANRAIASKLFISENTVKYHVRNILQKLEVQNRTEAVSKAISMGLIRTDESK